MPIPQKSTGFTLIELLVAIAIVAIISSVSMVTYSGLQKNARDARRQADIDAIATALESNKPLNGVNYSLLTTSQFANSSIPADTTTAKYCALLGSTTKPTVWAADAICPSGYVEINAATAFNNSSQWMICALKETGTNPNVYCRASAQ